MRTFLCGLIGAIILALPGCGGPERDPNELQVLIPTTLASVLTQLEPAAEAAIGTPIALVPGASGKQVRELAYGQKADVLITDGAEWITYLAGFQKVRKGSTRALATNRLVVAVRVDEGQTPKALDKITGISGLEYRPLAICEAMNEPAGKYTRQTLARNDLWKWVKDTAVIAETMQEAERNVLDGTCPAGILYYTATLSEPSLHVIHEIDSKWHDPIVITGAVLEGGKTDKAAELLAWLAGPEAQAALGAAGFGEPPAAEEASAEVDDLDEAAPIPEGHPG